MDQKYVFFVKIYVKAQSVHSITISNE